MERVEVTWHEHHVTRDQRQQRQAHHGCVIWFTGLSGCGKSTVANEVDQQLFAQGVRSFVLDGDNIRHGLNAAPALLAETYDQAFADRFGLGFSAQDRQENIRRIGAVAELFTQAGVITLTSFVSPYRSDRDAVRARLSQTGEAGDFVEVYVNAPLEVCESRDPKGLYKKARAGQLKDFTGIDAPYEPPLNPELELDSAKYRPDALAEQVIAYLRQAGKLAPKK